EAAAARQRLNLNLAASIRESLKLARLEEDEEKRVQAGIYQLEVRDAAAAAELRQIFVQRKGVLKTVIDLKPPYSALQTAFNPNMVCLDKDNQAVLVLHETNPAGPVITVPTAIPCQGNTSIEAQWARGTWGKAQRLGLLLN